MDGSTKIYHSNPSHSRRKQQRFAQTAPVAAQFEACQQCFARLCVVLKEHPTLFDLDLAEESLAKFRAWGNDTGAMTRSLDHTLRKASGHQKKTLELLTALHSTLTEVIDYFQSADTILNQRVEDVSAEMAIEEVRIDAKESGPAEKLLTTDPEVLAIIEDISELLEDIDGTVGCLVRLAPNLCDPFPLDLYSRDASISDAYPDIDIARELFPTASLIIVDRLGRANWKRRQYLKRLEDRKNPGVPLSGTKKSRDYQKKSVLREVAFDAFNFQKPTLKVGSLQVETSQPLMGKASVYGTSTAPSVVESDLFSRPGLRRSDSFTSFAPSEMQAAKRLAIPKPPVPLEQGRNFLCLYCRDEINVSGYHIKTEKDWECHVFGDLEPYLCTFEDCLRADKTYGARDDWFRHELDSHRIRKVWFCHVCREEFITPEKFEAHLQEKHGDVGGPGQMAMMISLCMKYSERHLGEQTCPLCATTLKPEAVKDHISDHLEQLALTSVDGDESSEEDDTDEIASQKFDDTASEGRTKLQILNAFAEEQFGYIHPGGEEPPDRGLDGNNLDFVGDSDGGDSQDEDEHPVPRVERDWRVATFLGDQPSEHAKTAQEGIKRNRSPRSSVPGLNAKGPRSNESAVSLPLVRTASHPCNEDFMGRDSDLANLYKILSTPGRLCIISGTGGMGKTATAVEFSYRYEQSFNCIFWVQAETRVGLVDTYTLIATQLGLAPNGTDQERLVELSRKFLDKTDKTWLLVFDNVDNWADIEDYLPERTSTTNGSILITTRNPDLAPAPIPVNYYRINLKELGTEEGRSLLIKGLRPDLKHDLQRHPEYRIAGEIAALAGLPLAIIHISGYVKASGCTLAEFWELWNEWRRNNLPAGATDDVANSETALETVWNIGLRELGIDALKVLKIMAFLNSDAIQKELLINNHASPSLAFLDSSQTYQCRRIINNLTSRKLINIKTNENHDIYSIHRLLQHRLMQDMNTDSQERDEIFCLAFELVRQRLPRPSSDSPEPAKWNAFKEYLPHVVSLQRVYSDGLSIITPFLGLSELFRDGGVLLWQRYISTDAMKLLNSAEMILNNLECEEDNLRVDIHITTNLLIQYFGISHRAESRDRLQKILEFRLKEPTTTLEDEICLNNARADYANALLQFNDYRNAEPIYQKCYKQCLAWGAEEANPFDCAKLNHHLAYCFMYRRDFAGAIRLAERAVTLIALFPRGDKQLLLRYKFDLACIVLQSGDMERALEMHKQILTARLDLQGRASYFTLQSYYAVGALCSYLGRLDEAEQRMRTALARAQERGGKNFWPEAAVARTQFHLHQILTEKGEPTAETERFARESRALLQRLLPFDQLKGVAEEDEGALFDHLQPVFGGRFTGLTLIKYVS